MAEQYLHGIEIVEVAGAPAPIRVPASSICGIVGTAEDLVTPGRHDVPVLVRSLREAAAVFGPEGTLMEALEGIFANAAVPVVCVNVFDPGVHFGEYGDDVDATLASGTVDVSGVPAGADIRVRSSDLSTTYTVGDATDQLSWDGTALTRNGGVTGTPAANAALKVSWRLPDVTAVPATAVVGGVDATTGARTGVRALLDASAEVQVTPLLLGAPGTSGYSTGDGESFALPVAAALLEVARRLRAHFVVEGPGTTDAAALEYPGAISARQGIVIEPGARVADGSVVRGAAATGYALGAIAAHDRVDGSYESPSGARIRGIAGTSRPIEFSLSDPAAQSNVLNGGHVAVIARSDERGWIWWGDRTCELDTTGQDAWKQWIGASRAFDLIARGLLRSHLWAVSKNLKGSYFRLVSGRVNAFLRQLRDRGAFQMARCEPSSSNTEATIAAGNARWRLVWEPFATGERLTFELEVSDRITVLDELEASAT